MLDVPLVSLFHVCCLSNLDNLFARFRGYGWAPHTRFPRDSYARDPESPKRENLLTTRRKTFLGAKWRRFIASLAMDGNASALNASRQGPSCQCQSMKLFERCRMIPKRWMEVVCPQCTMGKLKNGVKRSQVWQIISPSIFNQNLSNFERWCLNSQKII